MPLPPPAFIFSIAGSDATEIFEDIGHSADARQELAKHHIGILRLTEEDELGLKEGATNMSKNSVGGGVGFSPALFIVFVAIATGVYYSWLR